MIYIGVVDQSVIDSKGKTKEVILGKVASRDDIMRLFETNIKWVSSIVKNESYHKLDTLLNEIIRNKRAYKDSQLIFLNDIIPIDIVSNGYEAYMLVFHF